MEHQISGGGGLKLFVYETGNPDGQALVFIHGFSQSHMCWKKQLQSELAKDFRLIGLDIRGHGFSEKPKDVYGDSQLWADDINAVIETLQLKKPVLSGWSYGGYIILDYLRHYGQDKIAGVNWVAAATKMASPEANALLGQDFLGLVRGFFSPEIETGIAALENFMQMCSLKPLLPDELYFMLGYNAVVPPYVRQALFSRKLNNDDLLAELSVPSLVTHGNEDKVVLVSSGQHTASLALHSQTSYYNECGHMPFWEYPERFNRELAEFARKN